jgi:hypothetical protein
MKSAFLTEMGFKGKVPMNPNMRTEFCWMNALDADHFNIHDYESVKGYDVVFIIFPKAMVKLNAIGIEMTTDMPVKDMSIYSKPVVDILKNNNTKVANVQEGPSWFFNEYDMATQFNFFNQLSLCDVLFAHNVSDSLFYRGLFPNAKVDVIPSLMFPPPTSEPAEKNNKAIIGGNFCRWYGGFQSYVVASRFGCPIFVPSSHCKRIGEEGVPNLTHLPWVNWNDWMQQLSTFKYAVNLMPTVAAGTFSMNCAYFGIPCIGNIDVDTQYHLFPQLSCAVNDIEMAGAIADSLLDSKEYERISTQARELLNQSAHLDKSRWLNHIERIING